ncbi:MAG: hypothetical protein HYT50_00280 [Candidatus Wildermuthbacteria bacterium]|nr:hypothetical protein [Candidatus Wildermuthbacteria bacterium]
MVLQNTARIKIKACPRCAGGIIFYDAAETFCLNCGWRPHDEIPDDIQATIEESLGEPFLSENRFAHRINRIIGKGKPPPMSRWEKKFLAHASDLNLEPLVENNG